MAVGMGIAMCELVRGFIACVPRCLEMCIRMCASKRNCQNDDAAKLGFLKDILQKISFEAAK